ncbi:MAG TPA: hypothetical protein VF981_17315 [Gemmatimonadaceae bacterium]
MDFVAMTHPLVAEPRSHGAVREGVIAGTVGAATVALWFLVVDIIAGQPLYTPTSLGTAVMNLFEWTAQSTAVPVVLYTVFHVGAFALIGTIAVAFVHLAQRDVSLLLGLVILFVAFEIGFYLLVLVLDISLLGSLAWKQIAPANLLAALFMGGYLWRTHPALHGRLNEGLSGAGTT